MNLLLDRRAWFQSSKAFLASIVALYIALAGALPRPYWAMATVYIVTQPMLGPTRAKGAYRVIGTLVACVATLWALPQLVETPWLLSAAASLWLAVCLLFALLDRSPRGYAFMLAGYTAAIVGLPLVTAPESLFDMVAARAEEIILGTIVAVTFSAIFFPVSVRPMLRTRIGNWMHDASAWCRHVLSQSHSKAQAPRNRLAADLVQFEALIEFLRHDSARSARATASMQHLRERMLLMLPVLASIADRLSALQADGRPLPDGLPALIDQISAWLEQPGHASEADYAALRDRIAQLKPAVDGELDHLQLMTLLLRLEELVDLWQDCTGLQAAIEQGRAPADPTHYRVRTQPQRSARHVDWGMALFSASSAGLALMGYCALWILLGWEGGAAGATMAAIVAAFFAQQDDPAPGMLMFLGGLVMGSAVAAVYLFGIMPAIHDFGALVIVLALVFIPLGLLLQRPGTAAIGLAVLMNLAMQLSLQRAYHANMQSFVNSSVAMMVGIIFAVVLTRVCRSVGAEWSARRLVRQGWSTLAQAAEGRGKQDRQYFAARMLDLLGLLVPRMAATPAGSVIVDVDMLTEARIGLNILQLRRARLGLPAGSAEAVDAILRQVAGHYRAQVAAHQPLSAPAALRQHVEAALRCLQDVAPGKARDEALIGLVGLRYTLLADTVPTQIPA